MNHVALIGKTIGVELDCQKPLVYVRIKVDDYTLDELKFQPSIFTGILTLDFYEKIEEDLLTEYAIGIRGPLAIAEGLGTVILVENLSLVRGPSKE